MSTLNDRDRENLTAYLDGELDPKAAQDLEAKINVDPEARKEVDALRQAWGMLDYLPKAAPPAGFTHRTLERVTLDMGHAVTTGTMSAWRVPAPVRALGWVLGIALMAGLGLGAGRLLFPKPGPSPDPDLELVRHLPVIENWRYYEKVDDMDFLRGLDQPELFGE